MASHCFIRGHKADCNIARHIYQEPTANMNSLALGYGSIESSSKNQETIPPLVDKTTENPNPRIVKLLALAAVAGCFVALVLFSSSNLDSDEAKASVLAAQSNVKTSAAIADANAGVKLPSYLTPLGLDDDFDHTKYNVTSKWIIGSEGKGNIIPGEAQVVKFNEPGFVYRTYGGNAKQCGRWWFLNPPTDEREAYAKHFGICPSFNDIDYIVRCRIDAGFTAIVGPGQTMDCPNNSTVYPNPNVLQLNANVCKEVVMFEKHLPCTYCRADEFLQNSACSNTKPDYIDGKNLTP